MSANKELKKEMEAYDEKASAANLSIQDALIVLAIYAADIDPNHCRETVRKIVEFSRQQSEFIEISESNKSAEERVYRFFNEMQIPDRAEEIVDSAIHVVSPAMTPRAAEWMEESCKAIGMTEARKKKLDEIETRLKAQ